MRKVNTDKHWEILESINWAQECQSPRITSSALQRKLIAEYRQHEIIAACKYAEELRESLEEAYYSYRELYNKTPGQFGGDDSFGDMLWHVIGMGRDYYNRVLMDFSILNDLDSREGFQYVMMRSYNDFEEFEWHYHKNRIEQAYGKIMMMELTEGKVSTQDLAVRHELKARLEMILIAMEKDNHLAVLNQVRDMDPKNKSGSYLKFYDGWDHNEMAFYSNVLSDLLRNMFDESEYNEPVDGTPKVNKRQLLIEQLNCALNQALDGSCKTVQFEWDDTEFSVDLSDK